MGGTNRTCVVGTKGVDSVDAYRPRLEVWADEAPWLPPRLHPEDFRAAFTSAKGCGTFTQEREGSTQTERLEVRSGELTLQTLAFDLPADMAAAEVRVWAAQEPV